MAPTLQWRYSPLKGGHVLNMNKIFLSIYEISASKVSKKISLFFILLKKPPGGSGGLARLINLHTQNLL